MWSMQHLYRYRRQNTAGDFLHRHIPDRLTRGKSTVLYLLVPPGTVDQNKCRHRKGQ